ncbi:glycoprotein 3-alpha-L-fucosyltransferase A [Leptinotarsa decemlineata]|uniref:glycoprotein 3-alpha-L-fucosyltransferase A n=1 Tax=Leptinotarsa decemlineata TaxID=7539 RepID=UPI003D30614C
MPPRLPVRLFLLLVIFFFIVLVFFTFWNPNRVETEQQQKKIPDEIVSSLANLNEAKTIKKAHGKPWFMKDGTELPEKHKGPLRLFPDQASGDRIVDQLMYVPEDYQGNNSPEKVILTYTRLSSWGQKSGSSSFNGCPVSRCSLTDDLRKATDADAILFKDRVVQPGVPRPSNQVWIIYHLESPYHTANIKFIDQINWTATYRRDSDIVAPYERWAYYKPTVHKKLQNRDYAANKTKKVAWFVSNCAAKNDRLTYAKELGKYITVDIYGACGSLECPKSSKKCFDILERDYKFYLSFENSNCRDYMTEKFFVNGLGKSVLPIVMGGRPEDYQRSAPEGSYIHVDDFAGPQELAAYLHKLDEDNALYNSYFKWKGTGEFINTFFWCRLCAMMHAPLEHRHYEDINDWWRGPGVCTNKPWRESWIV